MQNRFKYLTHSILVKHEFHKFAFGLTSVSTIFSRRHSQKNAPLNIDFYSRFVSKGLYNNEQKYSIVEANEKFNSIFNCFFASPYDLKSQQNLISELTSFKNALSSSQFEKLCKKVYLLSISHSLLKYNYSHSATIHNVFYQGDFKNHLVFNDSEWIKFTCTFLSQINPKVQKDPVQLLNSFYNIHKLQSKILKKKVFSSLVTWVYLNNQIDKDLSSYYLYLLILNGDLPITRRELYHLQILSSRKNMHHYLKSPFLYKQIIKLSKRKDITLSQIQESGIISKFVKITSGYPKDTGFEIITTFFRAIKSFSNNENNEKWKELETEFWSSIIRYHERNKYLEYFENHEIHLSSYLKMLCVVTANSLDQFYSSYSKVFNKKLSSKNNNNIDIIFQTDIINSETDSKQILNIYGNLIRLLVRTDLQNVSKQMENDVLYSTTPIVRGYLTGLFEIDALSRITDFCTHFIFFKSSTSSEIKSVAWKYYLKAISLKSAYGIKFFELTLKSKLNQKFDNTDLRHLQGKISQTELSNAVLNSEDFVFLFFKILFFGRSKPLPNKWKKLVTNNIYFKPHAMKEILNILHMGFRLTTNGNNVARYQLSKNNILSVLNAIQDSSLNMDFSEFMMFIKAIPKFYPHSNDYRSFNAPVFFLSEIFTPDVIKRIIYIGFSKAPAKPWLILIALRQIQREYGLNIDLDAMKKTITQLISSIYGYDTLSGEIRRMRFQKKHNFNVNDIVDALNLAWKDYSEKDILSNIMTANNLVKK